MQRIRKIIFKFFTGLLFVVPYLLIGFSEALTEVQFKAGFTANMKYLAFIGVFLIIGKEGINDIIKLIIVWKEKDLKKLEKIKIEQNEK